MSQYAAGVACSRDLAPIIYAQQEDMGQEIEETRFTPQDFVDYAERLREETALLGEWFREDVFSPRDRMGGFELEAWLVDSMARPAPVNEQFLKRLDNPIIVIQEQFDDTFRTRTAKPIGARDLLAVNTRHPCGVEIAE